MERFNSKTSLFVTYHWKGEQYDEDEVLLSREYETYDEARSEMMRLLPDSWTWDDGLPRQEWAGALADGDDDVFHSAVAPLDEDNNRYLLAYLRPVLGEEGGDHE